MSVNARRKNIGYNSFTPSLSDTSGASSPLKLTRRVRFSTIPPFFRVLRANEAFHGSEKKTDSKEEVLKYRMLWYKEFQLMHRS